MTNGSNSAPRIAELRRELHKQRGYAKRARATASIKTAVAMRAEENGRLLEREIERMGGKVRR